MSFEFFSDMAVESENDIDLVVDAKNQYDVLGNAPWALQARILASGLHNFESFIKNGRVENTKRGITRIKGYPEIVKKSAVGNFAASCAGHFLPDNACMPHLPSGSCLFKLGVTLTTPFYSRDDVAFYSTENVLRKDWVFELPCLGATGIKGLLRWAWRISGGNDTPAGRKIAADLFGIAEENKKSRDSNDAIARKGCLYTYPLFWKGKVGLDIINPHDRITGTGTIPIKYEVVLPGATAELCLLLMNKTGRIEDVWPLMDALEMSLAILLDHSGLSAKRSVGWGNVKIDNCLAFIKVPCGAASADNAKKTSDVWESLVDGDGNLKSVDDTVVFSTSKLAELSSISASQIKKNPQARQQAKEKILSLWEEEKQKRRQKSAAAPAIPAPFVSEKISQANLTELFKKIKTRLMEIQPLTESGGRP